MSSPSELLTVEQVIESLSDVLVPTPQHEQDIEIPEVVSNFQPNAERVDHDTDIAPARAEPASWAHERNWGVYTWSWLKRSAWDFSEWGADPDWGADGVKLPPRPVEPNNRNWPYCLKKLFANGSPFTKDAAQSRVNDFKTRTPGIVQHLRRDKASGLGWLEMWASRESRVANCLSNLPWNDTPGRDTRLDHLPPEEWAKIQLSLVQYDRYQDCDGNMVEREPSFSGPMVAKLLFAAHVQWDEHHRRLAQVRTGIAQLKEMMQSLQEEEIAAMSHLHHLECHIYRLQRLEQCAVEYFD
ncbi:hypothetical protein K435DRAFT_854566 [Dendrothele bispora CBS 962.96]|uniref:Uncharacterized protein n=1 Tax=Dendrothele bispora (strain CBS 962.96) TaxID=1314807 RepID=A0A4S8MDJ5_DENBC|nr:hypothetical protein K435DRAFT_854566 [Dendrothele bispora CBS 962.96]